MPGRKIITASLEGMRVIVDEEQCEFQEYNFASSEWYSKEVLPWPLPRAAAEDWLSGWNRVDRFEALSALTRPADEWVMLHPAPRRFSEPQF